MNIEFNTGRKYAANGQRITVELIGDTVKFTDWTRCIIGTFPATQSRYTAAELQREVMQRYDAGDYEG